MAEIGKIHIDFQVLKTHDPKTLLIADSSDWKHIEDKPSIIEITLPGSKVPNTVVWQKNRVNIFNSSRLGFTPKACDVSDLRDLPDGIYTLKVIGSPDSFNCERKYLRTEKLQLELGRLYISLGIDFEVEEPDLVKNLDEIDFMIKASEFSTRRGEIPKAMTYYNQAKSLIENYLECEDCN